MLESLIVFFSMLMWLEIQTTDVNYYWSWVEMTGYVDEFEKEINIQEIQKTVIIEDYFLFLERLGRINYARGCAGEATPPTRNGEKRVRCWIRSFDCWWMMKYYGWIKGILTQDDMKYLRSDTLYWLWDPKDPRTAERWDFMYWTAMSSGNDATHFAVITTWYDDINHTLTIMDNFNLWSPWKIGERQLKVSCNAVKCWYMWKYRIYISSNWMVELANKRWILVNAFKIFDD